MTAEPFADAGVGLSAASATVGLTIGQVNEWLQAAAFIVAILSGLFAARYYHIKSKEKTTP